MKIAVKNDAKLSFVRIKRKTFYLPEKASSGIKVISSKFYQKSITLLIAFFIILILPESPKELERICNNYHSRQICYVW